MHFDDVFNLVSKIIGGFIIGAFCGVAPLVLGIIKKKYLLGILGIIACILIGTICTVLLHLPGFLAIVPAAIFILIIVLVKKK